MNEPAGSDRRTALDWIALLALGAGAFACVMLVLPYRSFDLDRFFAPKELALHVAALVAGIAAIVASPRLTVSYADVALIAWVIFSAGSAIVATNHALAFRALAVTVSGAAVFWSARRLANVDLVPALTRLFAAAVVAGAIAALAQAYGFKMEFAALNRAPGGTFGNRNFMAHLTAAGIPLIIWCIASARKNSGALLWTVSLTACAAALVLSRTRAAWLALAVSAALIFMIIVRGPGLIERADARRRLRRALMAVAAGVLLALVLPNSLDWRSDSPYLDSVKNVVDFREGSGRGRLAQYANSMKMAIRHPLFGAGPGNWPVLYPKFAPPGDPSLSETTGMAVNPWPSSDWVAAAAERGLDAFLAFAAFVALLLVAAARARYDTALSPARRLAAVAGGSAVLIASLEGAFDAVFLLPTPLLIVMGAAGALIPVRAAGRQLQPLPTRRFLFGAGFAAFTVAACVMGNRRIVAMRLYETGTSAAIESAAATDPGSYRIQMRAAEFYLSRGNCARSKPHAIAARDLFPYASGPRRVLAQCR